MKLIDYLKVRSENERRYFLSGLEKTAFGIKNSKKGWFYNHKEDEIAEDWIKIVAYQVLFKRGVSIRVKRRLREYFNFPEGQKIKPKEWEKVRKIIIKRDGKICQICSKMCERGELHIDHKLPASVFPSLKFDLDNLQVSCASCNTSKGTKIEDKYLNQFRDKLTGYIDRNTSI